MPTNRDVPQALLLAIRLWAVMPADVRRSCPLLPVGCTPPPADFFRAGAGGGDASEAAAAFFTPQHVRALLPVLRLTSQSHPRLHSVWPTLLALLLPGFTADKVRPRQNPKILSFSPSPTPLRATLAVCAAPAAAGLSRKGCKLGRPC